MQAHDYNDTWRITISEMSRRSQLDISSWFREWILGENGDKLKSVIAISTQIILHSRINLYRNGELMGEGVYMLEEGVNFCVPMTEVCLNDLPASLVAWMIDAAGQENAFVLSSFLAVTQGMTHARTRRPPFGNGPSSRPMPH